VAWPQHSYAYAEGRGAWLRAGYRQAGEAGLQDCELLELLLILGDVAVQVVLPKSAVRPQLSAALATSGSSRASWCNPDLSPPRHEGTTEPSGVQGCRETLQAGVVPPRFLLLAPTERCLPLCFPLGVLVAWWLNCRVWVQSGRHKRGARIRAVRTPRCWEFRVWPLGISRASSGSRKEPSGGFRRRRVSGRVTFRFTGARCSCARPCASGCWASAASCADGLYFRPVQ
jgi:hypothetical protein